MTPPMGRMPLHIDLTRYWHLPAVIRAEFDGWLRAEHLIGRRAIALTLGEGVVTIERYATDENGELVLNEDRTEPVRTIETIPVGTLPPPQVFA